MLLYQQLGWRLTAPFVRFLGRLYYLRHRREKAVIENAIGTVLADVFRAERMAEVRRRVFQGIYSHYYEKVFNALCPTETLRRFFETHIAPGGLAAVERALSRGHGALLVTGHYGGVEFMPGFLGYHGIPVSIVAHFSTARLRENSHRQAAAFRTRIIEPGQTRNIPRAIAESLQENRAVITQCDEIEAWRPDSEYCLRFLGRLTPLDRTVHTLARRMQAPLLFTLMHRDGRHRYRFLSCNPRSASGPLHKLKSAAKRRNFWIGAVLLQLLERFIYRYPECWYQWAKFPVIPAAPEGNAQPLPVLLPGPASSG